MLNLLVGGEAGQGLVTTGEILAKTLVRCGYFIVVNQDYESRIRGGHNAFTIRINTSPIQASREKLDILIALDENTVKIHRKDLAPGAVIIADEKFDLPKSALRVPYEKLAENRYSNVVALSVAAHIMGLDKKHVIGVLEDIFGKKDEVVIGKNRTAVEETYRWASERKTILKALGPADTSKKRMMMSGHEAVALGALAAGVKFCPFYPMSPATSIAQALAGWSKKGAPVIVEQTEDEIAAANMGIGASYAGAPAIVPTSGGGFALMNEAVSLAANSETPIVFVIAQRPGPATGFPTRTEQGDLNFVLHSGHGEFPRAILAPGDVEECFHLAGKALVLAEKHQSPVFLLTDEYLADSYRAVEPFDLNVPAVKVPLDGRGEKGKYKRYAVTKSGVSPRVLPGISKTLAVGDSHEHTEDGHMTERADVRIRMVEKRLRKMQGLVKDAVDPEFIGNKKPDLLLVSWGSVKGAAIEAAAELSSGRRKVSSLHFPQLWPLVPGKFMNYLKNAKKIVCVESNATGQFANLIRRETGFKVHARISKFDGRTITPEYIIRGLKG